MVMAEVLLPHGEMNSHAKVIQHFVDENGKVIGNFHGNPMLNTLVYECDFPDETIKEYTVNIIAENIFNGSYPDGHGDRSMLALVDHKRNSDAL